MGDAEMTQGDVNSKLYTAELEDDGMRAARSEEDHMYEWYQEQGAWDDQADEEEGEGWSRPF